MFWGAAPVHALHVPCPCTPYLCVCRTCEAGTEMGAMGWRAAILCESEADGHDKAVLRQLFYPPPWQQGQQRWIAMVDCVE